MSRNIIAKLQVSIACKLETNKVMRLNFNKIHVGRTSSFKYLNDFPSDMDEKIKKYVKLI